MLAFFVWKLHGDVKKNSAAIDSLKKALYENGFPTKAEVDKQDQHLEKEIDRLRDNVHNLRNYVTGMQRPPG